jgi:hypothetical protein
MDMVALELIKNLQIIDQENQYFIFVKPDEDQNCAARNIKFKIIELNGVPTLLGNKLYCQKLQKYRCDLYIVLVIQHHF